MRGEHDQAMHVSFAAYWLELVFSPAHPDPLRERPGRPAFTISHFPILHLMGILWGVVPWPPLTPRGRTSLCTIGHCLCKLGMPFRGISPCTTGRMSVQMGAAPTGTHTPHPPMSRDLLPLPIRAGRPYVVYSPPRRWAGRSPTHTRGAATATPHTAHLRTNAHIHLSAPT